MANLKGCFLHDTDDWQTPKEIYNYFMSKGYIDPCPYKSETDNLKIDLGGGKSFYKSTLQRH